MSDREKEIKQASWDYIGPKGCRAADAVRTGFESGARWADENPQPIVAITDGPIIPSNITIDVESKYLAKIARLERAMNLVKEKLVEMQSHLCSSIGADICSQMWYQDVADEALKEIDEIVGQK